MPISTATIATLNVARHFAIDDQIGGIAPGKYADIAVIPDLRNIKAEYVISNGQLIASGRFITSKGDADSGSFDPAVARMRRTESASKRV